MPLYRCTTPPGSLDDEQRSAIAVAITDIHCGATGAPPTFVHVQFFDGLDGGDSVTLHGGLRSGRDDGVVVEIIERCIATVSEVSGVAADRITMRTSGTPAHWIFEGGRVMPEPGQEAAWLAAGGAGVGATGAG
ncbi:MAG: tautomerase family protein [Acidimicrobiales bacterium]